MGYDSEHYNNTCDSCGQTDMFARERNLVQKEILCVNEYGITIDDSDYHEQNDWVYFCLNCENSATYLEDILEEKSDDEMEGY